MRRIQPIHIAYGLVDSFFIIERLLRQGESAKSLREGQEDRGSTRAVGAAFGLAVLALQIAPLLNRLRIGRIFGEKLAWGGVAAALAGLALRVWASRVLGAYYTRTLRTQEDQHLITEGPYNLVRHPGYLGVLLLWLGAGIATTNGIVAAIISIPLVRAYLYRIKAEEDMLANAFPQQYKDYARRTWRLIPYIY